MILISATKVSEATLQAKFFFFFIGSLFSEGEQEYPFAESTLGGYLTYRVIAVLKKDKNPCYLGIIFKLWIIIPNRVPDVDELSSRFFPPKLGLYVILISMTTTDEELDAKIAETEAHIDELNKRFSSLMSQLHVAQSELSDLNVRKSALRDTDFKANPTEFKNLCAKAIANPREALFRSKIEETIRSFPLPSGVKIDHIGLTPINPQPVLTLAFEKGVKFTDKDAAILVELIDFVDLADGFREHTPLMIRERHHAEYGIYTLVLESDNENARLYHRFFSQTSILKDGTLAEVLTEIADSYYLTGKEDSVDYDYEEAG